MERPSLTLRVTKSLQADRQKKDHQREWKPTCDRNETPCHEPLAF